MRGMEHRTVTTQGSGTAGATPDAVLVVLTVEVVADTPATALRECGAVQEAVLAVLGNGASHAGLRVESSWDHEHQRPGSPQAVSTVTARLTDLPGAGDLVTRALEAGGAAARLQSLTAVVTDPGAALALAREAAFAEARAAAEQYAGLAGSSLGALLTLTEVAPLTGWVTASRSKELALAVPQGSQDIRSDVVACWAIEAR